MCKDATRHDLSHTRRLIIVLSFKNMCLKRYRLVDLRLDCGNEIPYF